MKSFKAFKYRLYPNQDQQQKIAIQFGHSRFVYNNALNNRKEHYKETGKGLSCFETINALTSMKKDLVWLKDADSQVLQQKLRDLDRAYVNFFQGRAAYPRFKSKHDNQSIRYPQRFKIEDKQIYLPKIGKVKIVLHRDIEGIAKNVTISKTKSGKYFASIQCEIEIFLFNNNLPPVGVDLGIKTFAVLSTGEKILHPAYLRESEGKLIRLQRQLSKKKKRSANRKKARLKVAILHEKIANQRKDFLDKLSYRLTVNHGAIGLETLNVKGMVKNHCLAKSISDSGWSIFGKQCEYKAIVNGSSVHRVDRFFPSSKKCNVCGAVNSKLKLHHRSWICNTCETEHDRDFNASVNLEKFCTAGVAGFQACGESISLNIFHDIEQFSMKQEAQSL
jgi:putative transposase